MNNDANQFGRRPMPGHDDETEIGQGDANGEDKEKRLSILFAHMQLVGGNIVFRFNLKGDATAL